MQTFIGHYQSTDFCLFFIIVFCSYVYFKYTYLHIDYRIRKICNNFFHKIISKNDLYFYLWNNGLCCIFTHKISRNMQHVKTHLFSKMSICNIDRYSSERVN